jgi:hypothetical protein
MTASTAFGTTKFRLIKLQLRDCERKRVNARHNNPSAGARADQRYAVELLRRLVETVAGAPRPPACG